MPRSTRSPSLAPRGDAETLARHLAVLIDNPRDRQLLGINTWSSA
jgi:hypothetical protein